MKARSGTLEEENRESICFCIEHKRGWGRAIDTTCTHRSIYTHMYGERLKKSKETGWKFVEMTTTVENSESQTI